MVPGWSRGAGPRQEGEQSRHAQDWRHCQLQTPARHAQGATRVAQGTGSGHAGGCLRRERALHRGLYDRRRPDLQHPGAYRDDRPLRARRPRTAQQPEIHARANGHETHVAVPGPIGAAAGPLHPPAARGAAPAYMTAALAPLRRDRGLLALLVVMLLGIPFVTARIYASDEVKYF